MRKDEMLLGAYVPNSFIKKVDNFMNKVNKDEGRVRKMFRKELFMIAVKEYMDNYKFKEE